MKMQYYHRDAKMGNAFLQWFFEIIKDYGGNKEIIRKYTDKIDYIMHFNKENLCWRIFKNLNVNQNVSSG